jgi:hypothetical protein
MPAPELIRGSFRVGQEMQKGKTRRSNVRLNGLRFPHGH